MDYTNFQLRISLLFRERMEEEMPTLYLLMVHQEAWLSMEGGMTTEEPNNIVTVKQTNV